MIEDLKMDYLTSNEEEVVEESEYYDDEEVEIEEREYVEPVVYTGTLPSYFPEELIPPKEFESEDDELEFYRKNYFSVFDLLQKEEFVKDFFTTYEKQITQTDEEFEQFKAIQGALNDNPELAFKMFMPELIAKQGYKTALTQSDMNEMLADFMTQEFGENYKNFFVPEDANNPKSLSYRMLQAQERAIAKIKEIDARNRAIEDKHRPLSEEAVTKKLVDAYENDFKEYMTKQEYADFIKQSEDHELSLVDIYKVLNYEKIVKAHRDKAYNQGRKDALNELKKAKTKVPKETRARTYTPTTDNKKLDLYSLRQQIYN